LDIFHVIYVVILYATSVVVLSYRY